MKKRVITGIIMFIIFTPLLVLGGYFSLVAATFLSYVASYELIKLFSNQYHSLYKMRFMYPIYSVILVFSIFAYFKGWFNLIDIGYVIGLEVVFSFLYVLFNKNLKMSSIGPLLIIICYGGLMFGSMLGIRMLVEFGSIEHEWLGLFAFIYVVLCSFGTDIGAYTFGTLFGKHPFFHSISPKKSVEGSVLGSLCGTILGTLFICLSFLYFEVSLSVGQIIVIVIISYFLSMISEFGDLVASKFKREYNIKDYGNIFPGHGGVLDRFDSLVFTSTVFSLLLILISVW